MKRITLLLTAALVMALMLAAAGPALATVHPLANSECASDNSQGVANSQEPPGLTPEAFGGSGQSEGSPPNNPTGTTLAQPVFAVAGEDLSGDSPALKTPIVFPEPDFCPAEVE
jgi:hypothetical protein